jgi:hypothetical protein
MTSIDGRTILRRTRPPRPETSPDEINKKASVEIHGERLSRDDVPVSTYDPAVTGTIFVVRREDQTKCVLMAVLSMDARVR